jgi:alpha-amylase
MTDISLCFEVHQPYRIAPKIVGVDHKDLFKSYFDEGQNRSIFERIARKCYRPATNIILEEIETRRDKGRKFKVAFSLSGIFLEQAKMYDPELLELFRALARTGCVEFLAQTYFHSLASLYEDKSEFIEQVNMHDKAVQEIIGYKPTFFENTELLYNNSIARTVQSLGYRGIFTEGVERILGWRSPNYVYRPAGMDIKVLMRNYQLTDDIGFRFSSRDWKEYPLTADKYSSWLAACPGQCVNLFMDYETFGEHHWVETGIHDFLRHLPREILKYENLHFATPTEIIERNDALGEIDVSDFATISWADTERSTNCWLENEMQMVCFEKLKKMQEAVKKRNDENIKRIWRCLQTSDHLHHMYTGGGGPGMVHNYFSPYNSAVRAFTSIYDVICDFEKKVGRK